MAIAIVTTFLANCFPFFSDVQEAKVCKKRDNRKHVHQVMQRNNRALWISFTEAHAIVIAITGSVLVGMPAPAHRQP
jgi:hypothetical protein